jgi:hypothetical protein
MIDGFINTIRTIINNCLFNKENIDELPMYIIDYIFLKIRAKSIGEIVEAEYVCHNIIDKLVHPNENGIPQDVVKEPCNTRFEVDFNLDDAFVKFPENYNNKRVIFIGDNIGIKLKAPTFNKFRSIGIDGKGILDITDEYLYACIECVYENDAILLPEKHFNFEELKTFVSSFPANTVKEIADFFKYQPSVTLIMNITCPKCKNKTTIELSGLKDFFE